MMCILNVPDEKARYPELLTDLSYNEVEDVQLHQPETKYIGNKYRIHLDRLHLWGIPHNTVHEHFSFSYGLPKKVNKTSKIHLKMTTKQSYCMVLGDQVLLNALSSRCIKKIQQLFFFFPFLFCNSFFLLFFFTVGSGSTKKDDLKM